MAEVNTMVDQKGCVIWLTGLPSSGKSTIAEALGEKLRARGERVEILDGDLVRENLSKGLGFSKKDRDINVRRIGFVAHLLARNGVKVITAAISPYRAIRAEVRELAAGDFLEVYVATPLEECERRDVKGLYARTRRGEMSGLTGIDAPYEPPMNPEITIETSVQTPGESAEMIIRRLAGDGYLR